MAMKPQMNYKEISMAAHHYSARLGSSVILLQQIFCMFQRVRYYFSWVYRLLFCLTLSLGRLSPIWFYIIFSQSLWNGYLFMACHFLPGCGYILPSPTVHLVVGYHSLVFTGISWVLRANPKVLLWISWLTLNKSSMTWLLYFKAPYSLDLVVYISLVIMIIFIMEVSEGIFCSLEVYHS